MNMIMSLTAMGMDQTISALVSQVKVHQASRRKVHQVRVGRALIHQATAVTYMATASIDTDTEATAAASSLGEDHTGNPLKVHRVRVGRACIRRSVVTCMGMHTMAIELGVIAVAVLYLGKDHLRSLQRVLQVKTIRAPIRHGHQRVPKVVAN